MEPVPGVIDSDFRGMVIDLLRNCGSGWYLVKTRDVAQLVIVPCLSRPFEVVSELSHTDHSGQSFGSTERGMFVRFWLDCVISRSHETGK